MRRTLVVDACVLGAAGETEHPTSKRCRDFLFVVLGMKHRAALCETLRMEWDKHSSKYARQWRTAMVKKSKIVNVKSEQLTPIEMSLSSTLGSVWRGIHDTHLIVLALAADEIVVSLDETARKGFMGVSTQAPRIGHVCWVSPSQESEGAVKWAESGAKSEELRKLSSRR